MRLLPVTLFIAGGALANLILCDDPDKLSRLRRTGEPVAELLG
jgi:hypothetical protein